MTATALIGAQVYIGERLLSDHAVLVDGPSLRILPVDELPDGLAMKSLPGGTLMPGFVDLQLNGGGGVMLGDAPTVAGLRRITAAHRTLGTRAMMPTLITDTPEVTERAIDAVAQAIAQGVPGLLGLHLEGPHLDPLRAGAHDPALIRPMTDGDLSTLLKANDLLPNLMVTLAPEAATQDQIKTLAGAGVIVSLGHSDAEYGAAMHAFEAGAQCTTHLFNAMSQLGSRAPGLVGAALNSGTSAGLIADGIHVHPATIRAALSAHQGPGDVFLVSDAMACAGSTITEFALSGHQISRADGRLTLADGTLAGADLSMARAIEVMVKDVGDPLEIALARATKFPAALLRDRMGAGAWPLRIDALIYLAPDYSVTAVADML